MIAKSKVSKNECNVSSTYDMASLVTHCLFPVLTRVSAHVCTSVCAHVCSVGTHACL